ncbi:MAG: hypothetical protein WBB31_18435, partial [Saprospiraceae bacterium]
MATRLTAFAKFFITLLILGAIAGVGYVVLNKTSLGSSLKKKAEEAKQQTEADKTKEEPKTGFNDDDNTIVVQLVSWGGYGPGLYFNEGAEPNTKSRFYTDYGFKV